MAESKTAKKLTQVSTGLAKNLALFIQGRVVNDLILLVKERVTQTGINADGRLFSAYSTKPCLLGYSIKSDAQPGNKAYPLLKETYSPKKGKGNKESDSTSESKPKWVTIKKHKLLEIPGGYSEIRSTAGYQVAHKDFYVKGTMWQGVKAIGNVKQRGNILELTYGGADELTINILKGHGKREGISIIKPSKQELELVKSMIADYCKDYLKAKTRG